MFVLWYRTENNKNGGGGLGIDRETHFWIRSREYEVEVTWEGVLLL